MPNEIIVTGFNSTGIYPFNLTTNTYTACINGQIPAGQYRILCKGLGKIFLFHSNVLWDVTTYAANTFKVVSSATAVPNTFLISFLIRDDINIFFMMSTKAIFKFNLFTKEVTPVRSGTV